MTFCILALFCFIHVCDRWSGPLNLTERAGIEREHKGKSKQVIQIQYVKCSELPKDTSRVVSRVLLHVSRV